METIEVVKFINVNKKYLPSNKTDFLISKLIECNGLDLKLLHSVKFILPIKALIISLFLGIFGMDRFLIKDYTMGFIKLFTLGGLGFLTVFDWFYILKRVKKINYSNLLSIYYYHIHNF